MNCGNKFEESLFYLCSRTGGIQWSLRIGTKAMSFDPRCETASVERIPSRGFKVNKVSTAQYRELY